MSSGLYYDALQQQYGNQINQKDLALLQNQMMTAGSGSDSIYVSQMMYQQLTAPVFATANPYGAVATVTAWAGNVSDWSTGWVTAQRVLKQSPNGGPRNAFNRCFVDGVPEEMQTLPAVSSAPTAAPTLDLNKLNKLANMDWESKYVTSPNSIKAPISYNKPAVLVDTVSTSSVKSGKSLKLIESIPLGAMSPEIADSLLVSSILPKAEKKKFLDGLLKAFGKE